jgi:sRNA-binding carbon storage regulator CsrA
MRVLDVASRSDDVYVVRLHAGYWDRRRSKALRMVLNLTCNKRFYRRIRGFESHPIHWVLVSGTRRSMMLVISRRSGQRVKVGDCWITVSDKGGRISMAFDAPPHIKIIREELLNEDNESGGSLLPGRSSDRVRRSSKHGS